MCSSKLLHDEHEIKRLIPILGMSLIPGETTHKKIYYTYKFLPLEIGIFLSKWFQSVFNNLACFLEKNVHCTHFQSDNIKKWSGLLSLTTMFLKKKLSSVWQQVTHMSTRIYHFTYPDVGISRSKYSVTFYQIILFSANILHVFNFTNKSVMLAQTANGMMRQLPHWNEKSDVVTRQKLSSNGFLVFRC